MSAEIDRVRLAELMGKIAAQNGAAPDSTALVQLVAEFGDHLARSVGGIAKSLGRGDLLRSAADRDYLVWSAAIVLFDRAKNWDPAGSLPWVWAYRSIRAEVVAWIGHPSVAFDPRIHVRESCDTDGSGADIDLRALACQHEEVAQWFSAVGEVASERDRLVHLEYQTQKHLGDRSPAHTVSNMFGLSPANVRQIDTRVRRRLAAHPFGVAKVAPALVG